jgi:hypothetical protein
MVLSVCEMWSKQSKNEAQIGTELTDHAAESALPPRKVGGEISHGGHGGHGGF